MSRRSLITLILLLFTTGAVVFYLHLRKEAASQFPQVDQFLRQASVSGNWVLARTDEEVVTVDTAAHVRWKQWFCIKRIKKLPRHHYQFYDPRGTASVGVFVTHDSQRITSVRLHGQPADEQIFFRHLLEKFPHLQRFVQFSPRCPL
jgi:hypothetical protein